MNIAIFGAGTIGCFIGGSLIAHDNDVVLIGKQRVGDELARNGLTISDMEGRRAHLTSEQVQYTQDPQQLASADIILVTVKCTDTEIAAKTIAKHAAPSAIVYSLQNGVGNKAVLEEHLKGFDVLSAMVALNVIASGEAHYHRATDGGLVLAKHPASHSLARTLKLCNIPTSISSNMKSVLWGKLCLNLNNAINALADIPLKQQLGNRAYRRVLAACIEEALAVMEAVDIVPAKAARVKPKHLPSILNLPDPIFKLTAGSMLKMDRFARSSMWEDLQRGRPTEIDHLNGAIVGAGEENDIPTPANRMVTQLIKEASENSTIPSFSGEELLEKISA